jgi:3-oxoadipate enol-lactonase
MPQFIVPDLTDRAGRAGRGKTARLHYEDLWPTAAVTNARTTRSSGETAVVFLHMLAMDSRMWSGQVTALLEQGHRCLTLDFRGQGRSSTPRRGYDPDQLAADVVALLEHLRIDHAHLVGASMGGFVALRVALAKPGRVASLTLIGTTARREALPGILTNFALANILRVAGPRPLVQPVLHSAFGSGFLTDARRAGECERWADHFAHLRRVGTARAVRGVTHRRAVTGLDTIHIPTAILVGEHDTPGRHAAATELAAAIPASTMHVVPGAGHAIPVEEPHSVTTVIRRHFEPSTEGHHMSES